MHKLQTHCEYGTALLLDEQFTESWRQRTFWQAVTGRVLDDAIARGECVHLSKDGHVFGETHLHVDEPPPETVKYCDHVIVDQRLELPSGKLRFLSIHALVKDGQTTPPEEDFLTLQVEPGSWRVDVWTFDDHRTRLERPERLQPGEETLPGELPSTSWTRALDVSAGVIALLTLGALFLFCVLWRMEFFPYVAPPLVVAWVIRLRLYRVSGEQARERHNHEVLEKYLATLPEVPEWIVVLRRSADQA